MRVHANESFKPVNVQIQDPSWPMYFAADGNWGDALGIVLLSVPASHSVLFAEMPEKELYDAVCQIEEGTASIDQQDCPAGWQVEDENTRTVREEECGWSGLVVRYSSSPPLSPDIGGYYWTCPMCDNDYTWEPELTQEDWKYEVSNGDTMLGFVDWMNAKAEQEDSDD